MLCIHSHNPSLLYIIRCPMLDLGLFVLDSVVQGRPSCWVLGSLTAPRQTVLSGLLNAGLQPSGAPF